VAALIVSRREPGRSALSNHHEKSGLGTIGIYAVELLVTIGTIAILAAVLFPDGVLATDND